MLTLKQYSLSQHVKEPVQLSRAAVISGIIFIKIYRTETYLKNARVAQADTSLSHAALEQAKIRQVAQA